MMRNIVMFCGYIGSGKDLAATWLIENCGFMNVKMSGDHSRKGSLKKIVWEMFNLDPSKVEDRTYRESPNENLGGETPRKALQFFGHLTRQFYENVWVDNTVRHINSLPNYVDLVITDIRYINEYYSIKHMENENTKVYLIAIKKPDLNLGLDIYQDPSEKTIPDIQRLADYTVENDSTIESFISKIEDVYNSISPK